MTANSLVFGFATFLTVLLVVFVIAAIRPSADTATPPAAELPAENDHSYPRHARRAAAPPAPAAPVPPPPEVAGQAQPRPATPQARGTPPWEPAPAPTHAELIRATAEELTRLLYGWHPNIRQRAHHQTAAALSHLRAAIDASLLFGEHQK